MDEWTPAATQIARATNAFRVEESVAKPPNKIWTVDVAGVPHICPPLADVGYHDSHPATIPLSAHDFQVQSFLFELP